MWRTGEASLLWSGLWARAPPGGFPQRRRLERERELWSRPGSWQEEARYRRDGQLGCRRDLHANMSHSSMWHCLGALLGLQLFGTPWVPEATCFHHLWALETVHPGTGLSLSCLDHLSWWAQSPGTGGSLDTFLLLGWALHTPCHGHVPWSSFASAVGQSWCQMVECRQVISSLVLFS